jgi:hypothetical protein
MSIALVFVRNNTNKGIKKLSGKEMVKQLVHFLPIFLVDAILDAGEFDFALDQAGYLEFLQVLGEGGFGNGKFFRKIAAIAAALF